VGLRAGLDWCGKSRPTGIRSPDNPARRQSSVGKVKVKVRFHPVAGHTDPEGE